MSRTGELDGFCARHHVDLLLVHGSVLDPEASAADLDVALWPPPDGNFDLLAFLTDLIDVVRYGEVDVMDLSRAGVVARGLALGLGEPLYERTGGLFARRQMAALPRLADTAWIRDLGLATMAGR